MRLLQEAKWEARDDAEGILAVNATRSERFAARGPASANRENRRAFPGAPRAASFWRLPLPRAGKKKAASAFRFPVRWRREPAGRRKCAPAIAGAWPRRRA